MEKFAKTKKVSELKEGNIVNDVFFVKSKKGMSPYAKGYSFELTLSDNSGRSIAHKYWGSQDEASVKALYDSIKTDSIVFVQGKVSMYRDNLQLATNEPNIIKVLQEGQYNPTDFVKSAKKDVDSLYSQLLKFIDSVENSKIKELLINIFKDKAIENKFKNHPGASEIHHNWIGGLLEHTLEVLNYCKLSWETFPQLNKDVLIAGAALHDIGKLDELSVTSKIKWTNKGNLAGHLVLGTIFVSNKCDEIKLDEALKDKLLHIIISHHGKMKLGSPKEPMFPEAVVVHYSDELSSKTNELIEFIEDAKLSTEDDFTFYRRSRKNILLK